MSHSETSGPSSAFWLLLLPTEQEVLRSVGSMRTFAAGATLMAEGERADHVIVILDGQAEICLDADGAKRVLAVRGPGHLIGERAALQVSVRSATVIARDKIWALVVPTKDFAAFLEAHPHILTVIENLIYERLAENRPRTTTPGTTADTTPRVRRLTEKTARRLTGLAVAVGGNKRAWHAEEFLADLSRGATDGDEPAGRAQLRYASGLILGALRLRIRDACKPLQRLLDWSLAKPRTERIVTALTIFTVIYFWWTSGFTGLMDQLVNVAVVASIIAPALWLRKERGIPSAPKRAKKSIVDTDKT